MGILYHVCCLAGLANLLRPVQRKCRHSNDTQNHTQSASSRKENSPATISDVSSGPPKLDAGESYISQNCAKAFVVFALMTLVFACNWTESSLAILTILSPTFAYCALFRQPQASSFQVSGSLLSLSQKVSAIGRACWDNVLSLHHSLVGRGISPQQSCSPLGTCLALSAEKASCCKELAKQDDANAERCGVAYGEDDARHALASFHNGVCSMSFHESSGVRDWGLLEVKVHHGTIDVSNAQQVVTTLAAWCVTGILKREFVAVFDISSMAVPSIVRMYYLVEMFKKHLTSIDDVRTYQQCFAVIRGDSFVFDKLVDTLVSASGASTVPVFEADKDACLLAIKRRMQ